jgi:parallel beta-helix repeat protein
MASGIYSKKYNIKIGLFITILTISFFTSDFSYSNNQDNFIPISQKENNFSNDSPIFIDGNNELASFSSYGNGTLENPYIIENYFITTSNIHGNGLEIINTDNFFILRGIVIENTQKNGFHIENVTNGKFENNVAKSNSNYGFYFSNSSNLIITNNFASVTGLYFVSSNYNYIANNLVEKTFKAGYSFYLSDNNIFSTNIANNDLTGLQLIESNGNSISNNIFYQSLSAILLNYSHNNNIDGNRFQETQFDGIKLLFSGKNTIINNIFDGKGISLFGKIATDIMQKTVINNTIKSKNIT